MEQVKLGELALKLDANGLIPTVVQQHDTFGGYLVRQPAVGLFTLGNVVG